MNRIKWSGMTHPGRFRKHNEDAFLGLILYPHEAHYLGKEGEHTTEGLQFVFAVSDGMGGANAGDFASKLALQHTVKKLPELISRHLVESVEQRLQVLQALLNEIHRFIVDAGRHYEECRGMGATLSLCWVHASGVTFGHVGDSRIYLIRKNEKITQISEDHSEVGRLKREGKLDERQSKYHPERHILDQALGGRGKDLFPQTGEFELGSGDWVLLCTDGVCDGLYDRNLESTLVAPPPNIATIRPSERLVKEALFNSGKDNLTAMVLEASD